jgi:hypothetical protein
VLAKEHVYHAALASPNLFQALALSSPSVKVFWHVISQDSTVAGGNIPDSRIKAQIDEMNRDYAPVGLTFKLAQTTRTQNSDWFNNAFPNNQQEADMKAQLRAGGITDLNVYTVAFNSPQGFVGFSYFPSDVQRIGLSKDGVMIHPETMPGGSFDGFNGGKTLVHETGHWLGLFHTFQGGCSFPNDMVDDTPPSQSQTDGCPASRHSCPGLQGDDPIHNYMDYSLDACMHEFTPGQISRIKSQIRTFRGISL